MHEKISTQQLEKALRGEFKTLITEVVQAVNQARPGRIIPDSEELVCQTSALFRRRLYEKALQLPSMPHPNAGYTNHNPRIAPGRTPEAQRSPSPICLCSAMRIHLF
jgi:hypothetical protein